MHLGGWRNKSKAISCKEQFKFWLNSVVENELSVPTQKEDFSF